MHWPLLAHQYGPSKAPAERSWRTGHRWVMSHHVNCTAIPLYRPNTSVPGDAASAYFALGNHTCHMLAANVILGLYTGMPSLSAAARHQSTRCSLKAETPRVNITPSAATTC
jgi:hypothetical protein